MPKYLYRYRTFSQYSMAELIHGEFYFSSPLAFNDPFDCNNMFSFDGTTDDHWRIFLNKFLHHNRPELNDEQRTNEIERVIATGGHRNREKIAQQQNTWGEILTTMNKEKGIVCLSSRQNDLLMWSHYADCHKGFCLVFNTAPLQANFYCEKITYRKQYPTFGEFVRSDFDGISRSFLFTKSNHWKYENEYRLMVEPQNRVDKPGERLFSFPEGALAGIIFGCKMEDKVKQTLHEIAVRKWQNLKFYSAIKSSNSYSLKIVGYERPVQ